MASVLFEHLVHITYLWHLCYSNTSLYNLSALYMIIFYLLPLMRFLTWVFHLFFSLRYSGPVQAAVMPAYSRCPAFLLLLLVACTVCLTKASRSARGADEDDLIVHTTKGRVRGITLLSGHGKEVDSFLGIPYAKPPIGKYRCVTLYPFHILSHPRFLRTKCVFYIVPFMLKIEVHS